MVGAQSDTQCTIAYSQEFNLKIRFNRKFFQNKWLNIVVAGL